MAASAARSIDVGAASRASFRAVVTMPTPAAEAVPFEELLARLQKVVDDLERGDLPLEQSLAIFEEGVQLSRLGQRRLEEAEQRVERLLGDESGGVRTRPFDEEENR
jgi:exodeoxyribonuclease VII small subunit